MKHSDIYEKYFTFWESLSEADKNFLYTNSSELHFEKQQPVQDNMGCTGLYIVKSGKLSLYMLSEDGI